jgi:glucose/arabinose dehydrogenase
LSTLDSWWYTYENVFNPGGLVEARRKGFAVLASTSTVIFAMLLVVAVSAVNTNNRAAAAADVLLSRNKPVVASSSGGCCPPKNAVDGNSTTRWASGAGKDPQWIYVDLGASAHVTRVRLQWDLSCATAYRIETSDDHATWSTVFTTTTGNGGVDDLTVDGTGRYVRMFGTHRCRADATHGYSLQEFDVFGNGDQPPSAPGAPVQLAVTPTSATIRWAPATDDHGIAQYLVFRDGQNCATVDGNTLEATCTGLNPNFTYGFYVNAKDTAGQVGPPSPTTPITTPKIENNPPTAPTDVHPTDVTTTCVSLAWTAAHDDTAVASYNIYTSDQTDPRGTSATTSAQICGLTPDHPYEFTVTAVDTSKNEGPRSAPPLPVRTRPGICTDPICRTDQVGTDNDVDWGLVTLPDGSILINRRDAHNIMRLVPSTGAKSIVGTVPNVASTDGEGGLTGLEISPNFASDRWLYIMHTSAGQDGTPKDNRIVRIKLTTDLRLDTGTEQVLLRGIAWNKFHNGGRLRWGPDGKLYAGTGDAQNGDNAQNKSSLNGKVLRINPDGSIPADNPFHNAVWSYGHRNIQGLAFDSQGRLWEQEFGDSAQDETNLIVKGGNYGWPRCEGTVSHGSPGCATAGFIAPKHTYGVGVGSCSGIAIVANHLWIACERGMRLYRETITSGGSLTDVRQLLVGTFKRLRTVEPAPGGGLWLATSNNGDKDSVPNNSNNRIFRLTLGS